MAQETWALKLDSELKDRLQGIIKENFESSREFMEQLVDLYELDKLKQGDNILSAEVEELEVLTKRINGIFINANAKINTMLQDKDIKAEEQVVLKNRLIERLQRDIAKLEQEKSDISDINDRLVNSNQEYIETVNQLNKSTTTLEELVAEYKEKNDTLTGLLAEYKADREQNKILKEQIETQTLRVKQSIELEQERQRELIRATEKLKEQETKHTNEIEELLRKHSDELESEKRKYEMDSAMLVIKLKEENQSKLQAIQEAHNAEIEHYQVKYRELLEKLERVKVSRAVKSVKL